MLAMYFTLGVFLYINLPRYILGYILECSAFKAVVKVVAVELL